MRRRLQAEGAPEEAPPVPAHGRVPVRLQHLRQALQGLVGGAPARAHPLDGAAVPLRLRQDVQDAREPLGPPAPHPVRRARRRKRQPRRRRRVRLLHAGRDGVADARERRRRRRTARRRPDVARPAGSHVRVGARVRVQQSRRRAGVLRREARHGARDDRPQRRGDGARDDRAEPWRRRRRRRRRRGASDERLR